MMAMLRCGYRSQACCDDGQKNVRRLYFQQKESGPEGDRHSHAQSPVHGQPNSSRHSQGRLVTMPGNRKVLGYIKAGAMARKCFHAGSNNPIVVGLY